MRFLLFIFVVFAIVGIVAAGTYFSAPYWLPAISNAQGQVDKDALRQVVVVVPAAIAALVTSLVAGVASLLVASYQRLANMELENKKGKIIEDLDKKRNDLTKELEDKRTSHMKDLEDHKTKLTVSLDEYRFNLQLKRDKIDESLAQLTAARETATLYRFAVSALRMGGYSEEETKPFYPKLVLLRDSFDKSSELYKAWCAFMEAGHYLEERAEGRKPIGQRRLWTETSAHLGGLALGVAFAATGERVLSFLDEERIRIRHGK
jgi:hypothetical protein